MTARETLTTTLTNLFACTRNGRMDAHRAEAERMVDAVLHEAAETVRDEAWPHERDQRENELIYKLADLIDPEVKR